MKSKRLLASTVIAISLLSSTVAYAGGGWSHETIQLPAFQGYATTGNQYKWTDDDAATAVSWDTKYAQADVNFCAMKTGGTQIGERGFMYDRGTYGYSQYNIATSSIKGTNLVYLQMNTRSNYSTDKMKDFYWSPDKP